MENKLPLVSISCITFNHEPYIRQCLDGFILQKATFDFEVLIYDDASIDNTANIIKEFELKYPNVIKPIYQNENQYSKGVNGINLKFNFPRVQGKYIALCEGDDYWTDPLKLQKQVDFLEANPDYSLCCHRYKIYDEVTKEWTVDYGDDLFKHEEIGITFGNALNFEIWLTKSMTLMFRRESLDLEKLYQYKYTRDVHLNYELLKTGKGFCSKFDGAVYRRHEGGVFSKLAEVNQKRIEYIIGNELFLINKEDADVKKKYVHVSANFFDTIRNRVRNRNYSKVLFRDLNLYLKNEYKLNGLEACFFIFRKVGLSFLKSLNIKK